MMLVTKYFIRTKENVSSIEGIIRSIGGYLLLVTIIDSTRGDVWWLSCVISRCGYWYQMSQDNSYILHVHLYGCSSVTLLVATS